MKLALAAIAALSVAGAAQAAPAVQTAWSRPAAQGTTGAGFMTLANPDAKPDALVSVQTPWAKETQIHQSSMSGGMASMKRLDRVPLAPGAKVVFAPGGYHLMFMGLNRALKAGDALPATLTFASGAKVQATFVVGMGPPAADHQHHH
ncbi:MAG: copper chaperone PCu(A)C [Pseudomonadota bacterium]